MARTDGMGETSYFVYDAVGRQIAAKYASVEPVYFEYDAAGSRTLMLDEWGATYFSYDALGRPTSRHDPRGTIVYYAYGDGGERTQVDLADVGPTYYQYDVLGRMAVVQGANSVGTAYYEYDAASRVVRKVLGNGCFAYFAYDADSRVAQLLNCLPGGAPSAYFEYSCDAGGRITQCLRESGNVIYYGYDSVGRLTSEDWYDSGMVSLYAFQWDYELAGNRSYERRGAQETYYTYDAASQLAHTHEISADACTYFQYDGNGNCIAIQEPDGSTYFEYSPSDLVTSITYKNDTANYFYYDGDQRRYAMEESAGLRYLAWDGNGSDLLCEQSSEGTVRMDCTYGYPAVGAAGPVVAARDKQGEDTYYEYPVYDGRGAVVRLVDDEGTVCASYEYDAWGRPLAAEPGGRSFRMLMQNRISLADSGGSLLLGPGSLFSVVTGQFLQAPEHGMAAVSGSTRQSDSSSPLEWQELEASPHASDRDVIISNLDKGLSDLEAQEQSVAHCFAIGAFHDKIVNYLKGFGTKHFQLVTGLPPDWSARYKPRKPPFYPGVLNAMRNTATEPLAHEAAHMYVDFAEVFGLPSRKLPPEVDEAFAYSVSAIIGQTGEFLHWARWVNWVKGPDADPDYGCPTFLRDWKNDLLRNFFVEDVEVFVPGGVFLGEIFYESSVGLTNFRAVAVVVNLPWPLPDVTVGFRIPVYYFKKLDSHLRLHLNCSCLKEVVSPLVAQLVGEDCCPDCKGVPGYFGGER